MVIFNPVPSEGPVQLNLFYSDTATMGTQKVFIFILSIFLTCCSHLQRSEKSGYMSSQLDQSPSYYQEQKNATMEELGMNPAQRLDEREKESLESRLVLQKAEKTLVGKKEREQYFRNKPYIRTDRERLEFIRQGSYEDRNKWLNAKGISSSGIQHSPLVQSLIDSNEVALGMTKQAVRDSWGEPDTVEIAGNPMYGNERWHYSEQTSSTEGYKTQNRLVYFESGRVIGWESR